MHIMHTDYFRWRAVPLIDVPQTYSRATRRRANCCGRITAVQQPAGILFYHLIALSSVKQALPRFSVLILTKRADSLLKNSAYFLPALHHCTVGNICKWTIFNFLHVACNQSSLLICKSSLWLLPAPGLLLERQIVFLHVLFKILLLNGLFQTLSLFGCNIFLPRVREWRVWLVSSCCASQGLFRVAPSASKLKKLKASLDCGVLDVQEYSADPHAIAGEPSTAPPHAGNPPPSLLAAPNLLPWQLITIS